MSEVAPVDHGHDLGYLLGVAVGVRLSPFACKGLVETEFVIYQPRM